MQQQPPVSLAVLIIVVSLAGLAVLLHQRQRTQDAENARWAAQAAREAQQSRESACVSAALAMPLDTPGAIAAAHAAMQRCGPPHR